MPFQKASPLSRGSVQFTIETVRAARAPEPGDGAFAPFSLSHPNPWKTGFFFQRGRLVFGLEGRKKLGKVGEALLLTPCWLAAPLVLTGPSQPQELRV